MKQFNEYFTTIYYYLHPEQQNASISHQSIRILQHVQKEQRVTIGDIAISINISHNTASEHVKKLERNGWVVKDRSVHDQRVVYIRLTEEGLRVVKINTELDVEKLSKVWATLTENQQREIERAFKLLSEVASNVHDY
ncbi:MarR family transcriptional regulator [Lysinibacillus contaminans]|uniref:HTH-type transcriptional regulator MgrA n=1 Tax=Lysinibacillus contaminans TaxID=1293441 RepID=A0ABR5K3D8_9BACI|nr:winged helix-turn-helix transcriptional regulator [Lysinibacillus contaminans]KOS68864.1 MarR family transcriptional regulator [Lysinibacillus contaminans]